MTVGQVVPTIMPGARIAGPPYGSQGGAVVFTPMTMKDFDEPRNPWFLTQRTSERIGSDPRVNVAYSSDADWV